MKLVKDASSGINSPIGKAISRILSANLDTESIANVIWTLQDVWSHIEFPNGPLFGNDIVIARPGGTVVIETRMPKQSGTIVVADETADQELPTAHRSKRRKQNFPRRHSTIQPSNLLVNNGRSDSKISDLSEDEDGNLYLRNTHQIVHHNGQTSDTEPPATSPIALQPNHVDLLVGLDPPKKSIDRKSDFYPYFLEITIHPPVSIITQSLGTAGPTIRQAAKQNTNPYIRYKLPQGLRIGFDLEKIGQQVLDCANAVAKTKAAGSISKNASYITLYEVYKMMCRAAARQDKRERYQDTATASQSYSDSDSDQEIDLAKYGTAITMNAYKMLDSKLQSRVRTACKYGDLARWFGKNEVIWCCEHLTPGTLTIFTQAQWENFVAWAERSEEGRQWRREIQAKWRHSTF